MQQRNESFRAGNDRSNALRKKLNLLPCGLALFASMRDSFLPNRLGDCVSDGGAGQEDGHAEGRDECGGRVKGGLRDR